MAKNGSLRMPGDKERLWMFPKKVFYDFLNLSLKKICWQFCHIFVRKSGRGKCLILLGPPMANYSAY